MSYKTHSRFSLAFIVSVVLHLGLIIILGYSAWQYPPLLSSEKSDSIDAIMVDSQIVSEQYQRHIQQQLSTQQIQKQQQQQIEKQARELQQKQLAEQQRLKEQQKQALIAKQKAEQEAKVLAQKQQEEKRRLENERKQAEIEKQKALAEAEKAKKEAERLKQQAEQERLKAEKEKQERAKAEQEAKQKEQQQKQALEDILGGLTSSSNAPKTQQTASTTDVDQYKFQVRNAISNRFINPNNLYNGKTCSLKLKLAPDGLLLNVTAVGGDNVLCREAVSATKLAVFPKPKNNLVYQEIKEMTIEFKP